MAPACLKPRKGCTNQPGVSGTALAVTRNPGFMAWVRNAGLQGQHNYPNGFVVTLQATPTPTAVNPGLRPELRSVLTPGWFVKPLQGFALIRVIRYGTPSFNAAWLSCTCFFVSSESFVDKLIRAEISQQMAL